MAKPKIGGYTHNAAMAEAANALQLLTDLIADMAEEMQAQKDRGRPDLPRLSLYLSQMTAPALTLHASLATATDIAKSDPSSQPDTVNVQQLIECQ